MEGSKFSFHEYINSMFDESVMLFGFGWGGWCKEGSFEGEKKLPEAVGVVRYCSVCGEFACMCVQCEDISVSTILYNIFCNCRLNLMGVLE